MNSIINLCFLCTTDYDCMSVNEKIVSQVEYLLPEITIIKLGAPLRICSACDGALCAFSKFKQSSVESSRRLEASIKGAQSRSLHTGSPPIMNDIYTSDNKPEKMEEIFIKEEYVEETPLDTQMHTDRTSLNPISLVETIIAEPLNQLHKDRVSQNMQLHTDTNAGNIEEITIKEERMEETPQDRELFKDLIKKDNVSNFVNDDTKCQPSTSEEVWENIQKEETKEHRCNICNELFVYKALLARHMKENHWRIKDLSCTFCKKVFTHKYDLNKHMDLHNGIENFPCSICKKRFFNKWNLIQHMKLHADQNENKSQEKCQIKNSLFCSVCNKKFINKHLLYLHMKSHTGVKDIQCEVCDKSFTLKCNLNRHMKLHAGVKEYRCEICEKSFTQKSNLNSHMKIHADIKDFRCDLYNKSFTFKASLMYHMKLHSGVKEFQCKICDKSFTRKDTLDRHMKFHSGVKDFRCEVCDKSFTLKDNLKCHLKIHSDIKEDEIKKFECGICAKSFTQSGNFKRHMKIHTGEKEFRCEICDKEFVQKGNLKCHMKIHSNVQEFRCDV